jgi:hypothetical protein
MVGMATMTMRTATKHREVVFFSRAMMYRRLA